MSWVALGESPNYCEAHCAHRLSENTTEPTSEGCCGNELCVRYLAQSTDRRYSLDGF